MNNGVTPGDDSRAFLVNGKRELLISAEIHYARVSEAEAKKTGHGSKSQARCKASIEV